MTHVDDVATINRVLEELRPMIVGHGGDIQLVSYLEGIAHVKLLGACTMCPISMITVKLGIEQTLKEHLPGLKEVVAVEA